MIHTRSELIDAIKQALQYPHFCGDNWDAIEDLIYDIILSQKLIFRNWREVEKSRIYHVREIRKNFIS